MGADYIPLASSPSQVVDDELSDRPLFPRSPLVQHFSGNPSTKYPRTFLTKAFTKTRCLLLLPLIILPIIVHVSLLRLRDGVDPLIHDNLYFHTGDVSKHNAMVISNITKCRNLGSLLNTSSPLGPKEETEAEVDGCGSVETTVVILASQWFKEAYEGRNTASEAMYAQSAISTLNSLGYAYVFTSSGLGNSTLDETINMWKLLKGNVRMVWADPEQVDACWDNSQCIKTESNDEGIEGWRMMSFAYGTEAKHPLGAEWTLSPFQSNDNTLLSFSVEPSCRRLPPKTPHDRARRPQAYLFATQSTDLVADTFAWSVPYFKHLRQSLGIEIITGFQNDNETLLFELEKVGVKNVGLENKMDYYKTLSDSFVLIGAGSPSMSSSSWEALCLGVPFINPILKWDVENPTDRSKWVTQHPALNNLLAPHVYHVQQHDMPGFKNALKAAVATPIGSYVPTYMKFETVKENTVKVVEDDWKARAAVLLQERQKNGGETFTL